MTSDNKQKGERPWCEHCRKVGHIKDTCWKLHGKLVDWKPRHHNDHDSKAYVADVASDNSITSESTPFSKEQIETLQRSLVTQYREQG